VSGDERDGVGRGREGKVRKFSQQKGAAPLVEWLCLRSERSQRAVSTSFSAGCVELSHSNRSKAAH
jgi:hypothetical protein